MNLPTWYDAGTVSVANGSASVTGTNTLWGDDAIMAGDLFCDLAQPLVPPQRIASVEDDGSLTLAAPWPGTALTDAAYEIRYVGIIERSTAQTRRLLEQMSVVQANGRGLFYRFSDSVTDADPGSGALGLNNATIGSATAAYADNLDANGASVAGDLDTWDDSSSLIKGKLWLRSIASPSSFHAFSVTGSVVDGTGYRKLTLTYVGGSGGFADGEELMVFFVPKGDQGDSFEYDEQVPDLAGLAAYDDEPAGFVVLVLDNGEDPARSAFYTMGDGGSADWALTAYLTGPVGPAPNLTIGTVTTVDESEDADAEVTGTNPDYVLNLDIPRGARGVNWKVAEYSGATAYVVDDGVLYNGSSWRALQATTGNAPPTLPTTSNAYWQLLARQGVDGAGTVSSVVDGTGIAVDNTDPTAPEVSVVAFTGDGGSGGTIGGVPAPAAGDAAANRFLKADGTWAIAVSTDLETTVSMLALQAADAANIALFLGQNGNRVADSFDTLTFVDVVGATNLDTSVPGVLKGTPITLAVPLPTATSAIGDFTMIDRGNVLPSNSVVTHFIFRQSISGTYVLKIARRNSAGNYTILYNQSVTHVSGATTYALTEPFEVPGTGTYVLGAYVATGTSPQVVQTPLTSRAYILGDQTGAIGGYTEDSAGDTYSLSAIIGSDDLTVYSNAFVAAAPPSKMKGLLRVKEADTAVAGTDYTLECSRDNGINWAVIALSEMYVAAGLLYVEGAETSVAVQPSGTAPRWRFKTLNNKNVELHDLYLYWG